MRRLAMIAALAGAFILPVEMGHAQTQPPRSLIVISRDNGGEVVEYARKVSRARFDNAQVRFNGSCASACTLFLSLEPAQKCITRGTTFLFHKAYGARADMNAWGTRYMFNKYPAWVQAWISRRGGLTNRVLRMDYDYASRFIKPCKGRSL